MTEEKFLETLKPGTPIVYPVGRNLCEGKVANVAAGKVLVNTRTGGYTTRSARTLLAVRLHLMNRAFGETRC